MVGLCFSSATEIDVISPFSHSVLIQQLFKVCVYEALDGICSSDCTNSVSPVSLAGPRLPAVASVEGCSASYLCTSFKIP